MTRFLVRRLVTTLLVMLGVGIPLYICATASTPIAAALLLKGLSPGAALVFLLAGPATNLASLSALAGSLGPATTARYLAAAEAADGQEASDRAEWYLEQADSRVAQAEASVQPEPW